MRRPVLAPLPPAVRKPLLLGTVLLLLLLATGVTLAAPPLTNSDCWSCHNPKYHVNAGSTYIDCNNGCHDGFGENLFTDIYMGTHGANYSPSDPGYDCTFCHRASNPGVPQHGSDWDLAHDTTVPAGCTGSGCHSGTNLVPIHPGGCASCHGSTDPDVVAAIASGDLACASCHGTADHDSVHDGITGDPACISCHGSGVVGIHAAGCGACHASADPAVVAAIASGGATCGTCHPRGHYQGASLDRYLSWGDAKALMTANGVDPALQTSAHGNYTANTTKCAVCHSVHRAVSDRTSAGVGAYYKLTPGAQSCAACHTAWGANPIPSALIEWANPVDGDAGPHTHANTPNACLGSCHAGVHGGTMSVYGGVAGFNLTNRNDAAIAAAFAAGNVSTASGAGQGGSNPTGTYANIDEASFLAGYGPIDLTTSGGRQDYGVMRAMATGYTCGASGCHSSSQFAVNRAGYAEARAGDPGDPTNLSAFMTGHITNTPGGCAPCHGVAGIPANTADNKCATCHDMIGKATNSSTFPHGNRNIVVYEKGQGGPWGSWSGSAFTPDPSVTETTVASYNLWMYGGDATYRDSSGEPTTAATYSGISARSVLYGVSHGGPGTTPATFKTGDIRDGVCLKCHGYKYWPTHGINEAGPHGGRPEVNFATK